jgi:hypothetical protein
MHFEAIWHTTKTTLPDSVIQVSAVPGLSYVTALRAEKIDLIMTLQFKNVMKKSLQQNDKQLPLVPYCTKHRNKCLYSQLYSPTDGIWTHLPQHTDKPAPTQKLNIINKSGTLTWAEEIQWPVQSTPSFTAQSLNLQQKLLERLNLENENLSEK